MSSDEKIGVVTAGLAVAVGACNLFRTWRESADVEGSNSISVPYNRSNAYSVLQNTDNTLWVRLEKDGVLTSEMKMVQYDPKYSMAQFFLQLAAEFNEGDIYQAKKGLSPVSLIDGNGYKINKDDNWSVITQDHHYIFNAGIQERNEVQMIVHYNHEPTAKWTGTMYLDPRWSLRLQMSVYWRSQFVINDYDNRYNYVVGNVSPAPGVDDGRAGHAWESWRAIHTGRNITWGRKWYAEDIGFFEPEAWGKGGRKVRYKLDYVFSGNDNENREWADWHQLQGNTIVMNWR